MKTVSLLISIVFMCMGCNCQKKATDLSNHDTKAMTMGQERKIMEYEAYTRGSYFKVTIENQTLSVIKKRDALPVVTKISDADWKEIMALYKNINLKGLAGLKAPSETRFYDGAAIASFKVISGETTYQTPDFDGGSPNAAIEKIVNKLADLAEKQK